MDGIIFMTNPFRVSSTVNGRFFSRLMVKNADGSQHLEATSRRGPSSGSHIT
jgi:hypothetical protein